VIGFITGERAGRQYLAHQHESVFYGEATFLSAGEVEQLLLESGFAIGSWTRRSRGRCRKRSEIEPLRRDGPLRLCRRRCAAESETRRAPS